MRDDQPVEFIGDLVYKKYPQDVALEYEKAKVLWKIANSSGFLFPEPIELREGDSTIVYRNLRVYGTWESIRSAYLDYMTAAVPTAGLLQVFAEAGRVLGAIHQKLEVSTSVEWSPDPGFRSSLERIGVSDMCDKLPSAYLHCDYGFSNVLWSRETGSVATFDPSPDGYTTFRAGLRGSPYVDLGQFMSCLEGRVPLRHYPRMRWRRLGNLKGAFLDGYAQTACAVVELDCVRRYGFAAAEANFRNRLRSRAAIGLANRLLYNRFKGNAL